MPAARSRRRRREHAASPPDRSAATSGRRRAPARARRLPPAGGASPRSDDTPRVLVGGLVVQVTGRFALDLSGIFDGSGLNCSAWDTPHPCQPAITQQTSSSSRYSFSRGWQSRSPSAAGFSTSADRGVHRRVLAAVCSGRRSTAAGVPARHGRIGPARSGLGGHRGPQATVAHEVITTIMLNCRDISASTCRHRRPSRTPPSSVPSASRSTCARLG
jgi:hypothetical protein